MSAVTAIGSPLTLGSAVKAEATAAVAPPVNAGITIAEGITAEDTPTAVVTAAPVIKLLRS